MLTINWTDPSCKISKYFTVREALWLPSWGRMANESDGLNDTIKMQLVALFMKMDLVRDTFNRPILVHVAYRPVKYNEEIKGAKNSAHLYGMAVDFHVKNIDCDSARLIIVGKLDTWNMRCENLPKSNWIHMDQRQTEPRFFRP